MLGCVALTLLTIGVLEARAVRDSLSMALSAGAESNGWNLRVALWVGILVALTVGFAHAVASRWTRPLHQLRAALKRIAQGQLGTRLPERGNSEIAEVIRDINRMACALQQVERSRRTWMAEISHELRTPLTVLRGDLEDLIDGARPLQVEAMRALLSEVLALGTVVNDLHLLAMSDLDALPCHFEDIDAAALVRQVSERFSRRALAKGITLRCEIPSKGSMHTRWDGIRVTQLLINLLENSLRYTDAPGCIEVRLHPSGKRLELEVFDSAPNVPADILPRLFDPLFRADRARSRACAGSGLGLAICAAIVRAHQGRIEAGPSPLGGLRVVVGLPRDPHAD
ncbi:signal transduction histidine kinase [Actimicrobium sp. GrIS 1.19]|uniref:ATP-binding protein n=1 Tax=Actimicrobium sp. GrIS 1.19 TaxID=3071708 RepID=UPI002DFCB46F|nr:signal transduction histidine kinase [Actimicrobium sp. GrIS 1.19]